MKIDSQGSHLGPIFAPKIDPKPTKKNFIRKQNFLILICHQHCLGILIYHLNLRPGSDLIQKLGGLHKFMNWDRPILTDSGGFQGFSLEHLRKITEDGISFKSHIDGSSHILTPEKVIQIQFELGSNIWMPLDVCLPPNSNSSQIDEALQMTSRWMERSLKAKRDFNGDLFGIVQGGLFTDLRKKSVEMMTSFDLPGYSIGGLSVGESKEEMYETLDFTTQLLPENKPRYLMGVGTPSDIIGAVKRGIDMFDCVLPTRSGRTGLAFTWNGRVQIRNSINKYDNSPLDTNVFKFNLNKYTKNYLNHLFNTNEMLASMILSLNNINFYQELMSEIRKNIKKGTFDQFHDKYINKL